MSKLVLLEWITAPVIVDISDPDIATIVRVGEKVFAYGVDQTRNSIDKTNVGIILKTFGKGSVSLAKVYKQNLMAVNHMNATNIVKLEGGKKSLNQQRVEEIELMNRKFAEFFLAQLHILTWKDFSKGVQSTIPFDDAFKMLKAATMALYDLLVASVDDKFNKDLSISEMTRVADLHNLNNDYALGKK